MMVNIMEIEIIEMLLVLVITEAMLLYVSIGYAKDVDKELRSATEKIEEYRSILNENGERWYL